MYKHLIASGCSFTDEVFYETWATPLSKHLNTTLTNLGIAGSGNPTIARQTIHEVSKLLSQGHDASDILVGVMWSHPDRTDHFFDDTTGLYQHWVKNDMKQLWCGGKNPVSLAGNHTGWVIQQAHFPDEYSNIYYTNFWSPLSAQIATYEEIIRLQSYLKSVNVEYFFTNISEVTFDKSLRHDYNISWMHDIVDWTKWLDCIGCYEWCRDNTMLKFPESELHLPWQHPTTDMHKLFAEKVILKFLEKR